MEDGKRVIRKKIKEEDRKSQVKAHRAAGGQVQQSGSFIIKGKAEISQLNRFLNFYGNLGNQWQN